MSPSIRSRILVVEDDPGMARLQQKRLQLAGHSACVAGDAETARKAIATEGSDLMLLDYRLSGRETGLEFFEHLKAEGYEVPTILVTGFSNEALVIQALRAGIRDFVTKSPEYLEYLPEAVERTLRQVRLERRLAESEAQLKGILDSAMDAILTVDEQLRVAFCNAAAEAMFACPTGELIGQPIERYIPALFAASSNGAGPDRWAPPGAVLGARSTQGKKRSGELFPVDIHVSRGASPGRAFFTIVARDMTEHNRMLEEMLRHEAEAAEARVLRELAETRAALLKELEAANKELEAFSYSVSHDLRGPLRAIDGFARIVLRDHSGEMPPQAVGLLQDVLANAAEMARLIDDLLRFARLSRQSLRRQTVDSRAIVDECLTALRSEREGRQVEFHIGELGECQADPGLLKQVWINLVSNALKYTAGRAPARIEIGCREAERGEVVYFIADNGVGFDMRYAGKLFGVFQRLHRAEDYPGTGVGLATVQRIIHRHGGRVWAEAQPDQGATFYFTLQGQAAAQ